MRSLTHHLDDPTSGIGRFLQLHLPNGRDLLAEVNARLRQDETIRPEASVNLGTSGTAFDYRARYYFTHTPADQLVAAAGAQRVALSSAEAERYLLSARGAAEGTVPPSAVPGLHPGLINLFFSKLDAEVSRLSPQAHQLADDDEALLVRYCIVLGWMEQCYRVGPHLFARTPLASLSYISDPDDMLDIPTTAAVGDVCVLSRTFYDESTDLLRRAAVCNPTFPAARGAVSADADLIIGGWLVDLKCTVQPRLTQLALWQLVAYLLLDQDDMYRISGLGFYMARQRRWITWPAERLVARLTGDESMSVARLRAAFRPVLQAEAGHASLELGG